MQIEFLLKHKVLGDGDFVDISLHDNVVFNDFVLDKNQFHGT